MALPFSGVLAEEDVEYVCRELQSALKAASQDG
jgi:hypothetical protein